MNPENVKYSSAPQEGTAAESELIIFRSELPTYNPSSNKFVRINLPVAPGVILSFPLNSLTVLLSLALLMLLVPPSKPSYPI